MKKSLLSLAVIAVSLSACDTTPKYNINGTITGGEANNVYLLQRQGRTIDTLAKAKMNKIIAKQVILEKLIRDEKNNGDKEE